MPFRLETMAEWESPQGLELRNGKREVRSRISSKKNNYFIKRNVGIREMIPNGALSLLIQAEALSVNGRCFIIKTRSGNGRMGLEHNKARMITS